MYIPTIEHVLTKCYNDAKLMKCGNTPSQPKQERGVEYMKKDLSDLAAELDSIAAIAFMISHSLSEDSVTSDRVIGDAVHGIATYIERVASDVANNAE